ncbi:hypothetical protein BJ912DRAFT_1142833 [Pholiota molesta]|nr:hypothetical protein BJ912DRAFT_1142833 [Pholiota molesta]
MSESISTFGDALPNAGTHLGSSSDDSAGRDPTTNTPSQILLEALQNFVLPLIHTAEGKNKKVHSMGPEAGKLLIALQEFVSSMIVQSQVGQPESIEVDLDDPVVDSVSLDDAMAKSFGVAAESKLSDPGPWEALTLQQTRYQHFIGRLQEAVRKHVFSKMPIRVLHFTDTLRGSGTKLQITLLERNDVYGRIIKGIQASYSGKMFEERVVKVASRWKKPGGKLEVDEQFVEDHVIKEIVQENTKYAILSHTWLRGSDSEVTYGAWRLRQFDTQRPGYQKLANFCKSAWKDHGLSFGWMDTICINKDSSSELDESIRSMYKWYAGSDICITYLAETVALDDIHRDPWFTRGWTFQELLAPDCMTFYSKHWKNETLSVSVVGSS